MYFSTLYIENVNKLFSALSGLMCTSKKLWETQGEFPPNPREIDHFIHNVPTPVACKRQI